MASASISRQLEIAKTFKMFLRSSLELLPTFRFILISSLIFSTAGCATIAPRNVLPQADAGQIELEGFHNIRFWGDASVGEIQAVMMADASKTEGRLSSGGER